MFFFSAAGGVQLYTPCLSYLKKEAASSTRQLLCITQRAEIPSDPTIYFTFCCSDKILYTPS